MGAAGKAGILKACFCALLACGQLIFAVIFTWRLYIISQTDWYTLDSRWFFPVIALASFWVLAKQAVKGFVAERKAQG